MAQFSEFPDTEALVSKVIRDGVVGSRVYSSIPNTPTYPLMLVKRIGGSPVQRAQLDAAEIQIDVYAQTKSEARRLAVQARNAIWLAEGSLVTAASGVTGYITGVRDSTGLAWMPDPSNPPLDRYVFGMTVFAHA